MMRSVAILFVMVSGLSAAPPAGIGRIDVREEESPEVVRHKTQFANLPELQPQMIAVKLATSQDAQRAKIRPLPLYDGAEWAVTSRWDDNTWTNLKTRAVLLEHGHRGTFFLNDPARNFYGKDHGLLAERSLSELGKVLASGGTTIGGHSLSTMQTTIINAEVITIGRRGYRQWHAI